MMPARDPRPVQHPWSCRRGTAAAGRRPCSAVIGDTTEEQDRRSLFRIPWVYTVFTGHVQGEYHPRRSENTMGKVMFGLSMSLDGFIADKNDDVSQVFAWMGSAWEHFNEVVGDSLSECGGGIMGRRSFDQIYSENGWVFPDGTSPDWPVIVLQSQARESVKKGKTHFHFVTDGIQSAIT